MARPLVMLYLPTTAPRRRRTARGVTPVDGTRRRRSNSQFFLLVFEYSFLSSYTKPLSFFLQ